MATTSSIALINIMATQFIISSGLSSRYNLDNNNFYSPAYHFHGYKTGHKYQNQLKNYQLNNNNDFYSINVPRTKQSKHHHRVTSIRGGARLALKENAERKITFYENLKPEKIKRPNPASIKKPVYENFVTPKLEPLPKKSYEVTTKATREFMSTARPPRLTDHDVPIALDDEDVVDEDVVDEDVLTSGIYSVKGRRRPEHLNPLVYGGNYGKVHKRPGSDDVAEASVRDYGLERPGRVVVHHSPGYLHGRGYDYGVLSHYKKHTGRVRMQVFRGPTRKYGRKRYAPWGYYVVQPSADDSHHYP